MNYLRRVRQSSNNTMCRRDLKAFVCSRNTLILVAHLRYTIHVPISIFFILKGSEVTGDALRSVLEGLRLHLPRLTSPQVMEDTCGSDGRYIIYEQ